MTSVGEQSATAKVAAPLSSWNDGTAKRTIVDFVQQVTDASSPSFVPPEARVAVFDNDGTLWCEKPMPIQADFLLRQVGEMAAQRGWTVISMKDDWTSVFGEGHPE